MNILLIGNGFDLAHDLPTKYGDFLLFAKMIQTVIEKIGIKEVIPTNDKEFKSWTDDIENLQCSNLDSIFSNQCHLVKAFSIHFTAVPNFRNRFLH